MGAGSITESNRAVDMSAEEFWAWLNSCPSTEWFVSDVETGCARVFFTYEEEEDEA